MICFFASLELIQLPHIITPSLVVPTLVTRNTPRSPDVCMLNHSFLCFDRLVVEVNKYWGEGGLKNIIQHLIEGL